MPYFLSSEDLEPGAETTLTGPEATHLLGSRRLKPGDRFALQDLKRRRFEAELLDSPRGKARVRFEPRSDSLIPSPSSDGEG